MTALPDTPSALLTLALDDLEKAEADERYVIDMSRWHEMRHGSCVVCLAGAVMAFSLKTPFGLNSGPIMHSEVDRAKLEAIDYLREGSYVSGLRVLLGPDYNAPKIDEVADLMRHARKGHHYSYRNDAAGFKAGLRAVAAVLKERGL